MWPLQNTIRLDRWNLRNSLFSVSNDVDPISFFPNQRENNEKKSIFLIYWNGISQFEFGSLNFSITYLLFQSMFHGKNKKHFFSSWEWPSLMNWVLGKAFYTNEAGGSCFPSIWFRPFFWEVSLFYIWPSISGIVHLFHWGTKQQKVYL